MSAKVKAFIWATLLISIFLAAVISPFASSWPDGLEKVAEDKGFLEKGETWAFWKSSPIPDYALPGLGESPLATSAAGIIGTLVVFAAAYGLALLIRPIKKRKTQKD